MSSSASSSASISVSYTLSLVSFRTVYSLIFFLTFLSLLSPPSISSVSISLTLFTFYFVLLLVRFSLFPMFLFYWVHSSLLQSPFLPLTLYILHSHTHCFLYYRLHSVRPHHLHWNCTTMNVLRFAEVWCCMLFRFFSVFLSITSDWVACKLCVRG